MILAQIMISQLMSSRPAGPASLSVQSLLGILYLPFSLPFPHSRALSSINKHLKTMLSLKQTNKQTRGIWWLSQSIVQLLISAQVMILQFWEIQLCQHRASLRFSLSLSLGPSPAHALSVSLSFSVSQNK